VVFVSNHTIIRTRNLFLCHAGIASALNAARKCRKTR
jgi:hypothetical protein